MDRENRMTTKPIAWSEVVRATHAGVMGALLGSEKSVSAPRVSGGGLRSYKTSLSAARVEEKVHLRSALPGGPCFRCGARGWCSHRSAVDA